MYFRHRQVADCIETDNIEAIYSDATATANALQNVVPISNTGCDEFGVNFRRPLSIIQNNTWVDAFQLFYPHQQLTKTRAFSTIVKNLQAVILLR